MGCETKKESVHLIRRCLFVKQANENSFVLYLTPVPAVATLRPPVKSSRYLCPVILFSAIPGAVVLLPVNIIEYVNPPVLQLLCGSQNKSLVNLLRFSPIEMSSLLKFGNYRVRSLMR